MLNSTFSIVIFFPKPQNFSSPGWKCCIHFKHAQATESLHGSHKHTRQELLLNPSPPLKLLQNTSDLEIAIFFSIF